jgi:hypothetical protein
VRPERGVIGAQDGKADAGGQSWVRWVTLLSSGVLFGWREIVK